MTVLKKLYILYMTAIFELWFKLVKYSLLQVEQFNFANMECTIESTVEKNAKIAFLKKIVQLHVLQNTFVCINCYEIM